MSAPDGDLERQAKHHRGPLGGMMAAVIFAAILLVGLLAFTFSRGGPPEGADAQVTSGVGTEPATSEGASANDSVAEEAGSATGAAPVEVQPETPAPSETAVDAPADTDPAEAAVSEPAEGAATTTD